MILEHLEAITAPVGRLVKPDTIDLGIEQYRVTALVETKLRSFVPHVNFPLEHSILLIDFDFEGRNVPSMLALLHLHASGLPMPIPIPGP